MKIHVASLNPQKLNAVKELILDYPFLKGAEVIGVTVASGVADQPMSLQEIVQGAINRSKSASPGSDLSFGIESGVFDVPFTKSGVMDICACSIFDGKETHIGLSSAFEPPRIVIKLMRERNINMSEACAQAELTANPHIGSAEGLIGMMTNGRLDRLGYTKQAVLTALVHLENSHIYNRAS